jgi:hypothetical protein
MKVSMWVLYQVISLVELNPKNRTISEHRKMERTCSHVLPTAKLSMSLPLFSHLQTKENCNQNDVLQVVCPKTEEFVQVPQHGDNKLLSNIYIFKCTPVMQNKV